jgi:uroporphyrinogen-III synthase
MTRPLEGLRVALAEGRQLEELAQMLEKEGATAVRCPMVSILDAPDAGPVMAWLGELIENRFAWVVLMTGEGLRRLLAVAEREGLRDSVIAALARTKTLTRGYKPVRALKEIGLVPNVVGLTPTMEGIITALMNERLQGLTVGVQLYEGASPGLVRFLDMVGATPRTVVPYIYAPAADGGSVAELIEQMADGKVGMIVFTSSPQVDRLYEVAHERDLESKLQTGLTRLKVAAVGPVVAENLRRRNVRVDICPEQGFVMKNLVQQIKRGWQ